MQLTTQGPDDADVGVARFRLRTTVNGRPVDIEIEPREALAEVLRERLHLTGVKIVCEVQVCGACTVLVDGLPVSGCTYLAYEARGRDVLTIEGLAPGPDQFHPLQTAFIEKNAFQCGYCTPGMILAAKALLDHAPGATEPEIIEHMDGNICRCTGYRPIVEAIRRGQSLMAEPAAEA